MSGSCSVLPVVDAVLGTVSFSVRGEWHSFWNRDPATLLAALNNSVGRCGWEAAAGVLVVTVAKTGHREGEKLAFQLLPHPHETGGQASPPAHRSSHPRRQTSFRDSPKTSR